MTNEKRDALTERRIQAILNDQRFAALRTRGARVSLSIAMILVVAAQVPAWLFGGDLLGLAALVVAIVVWWMLRRSVRLVADLPDEYLDERQVRLRNAAYLESYRWLAGVTILVAASGLAAFTALKLNVNTGLLGMSWVGLAGLFWGILMLALAMPSIVIALRDREPTA